jgi:sugar/nucleoside kinase (ribokinase family)
MAEHGIEVVVVGSVGLDTIETPHHRREEVLGGSASFACAAASFFSKVGMVGVVGTDFPSTCRDTYDAFKIDCAGLQVVSGETFRWSGVYEQNMDQRRTLHTALNVFADFTPALPEAYRHAPYYFLANINPELQLHVLEQAVQPRFVIADTMDLWIEIARGPLTEVIRRVDMLTLNESEARHYTGKHNLITAASALLELGPHYVLIKKGEHGALLFSRLSTFIVPAFPLELVVDPTGAGDTFAGGMMGALASLDDLGDSALRQSMVYGTVTASFGVESFSLDRLLALDRAAIEERVGWLRQMVHIP